MKRILVIGIILLFIGMSISSSSGNIIDCSHSMTKVDGNGVNITINGTMGKRGWYISPVIISFNFGEGVIEELEYSITEPGEDPDWKKYTGGWIIFKNEGHFIFLYKYKILDDIWIIGEKLSLKIDYSLPTVGINRPKIWRIYIFGFTLFRISKETPLMIGKSTITSVANDKVSGVYNVSFLLSQDNETINYLIKNEPPYELRLMGRYIGNFNLFVEVEDVAGFTSNSTLDIEIIKLGYG